MTSGPPAIAAVGPRAPVAAPGGGPGRPREAPIARLANHRYLAAPSLATVLYLGLRLGKPVLLEGEAGVGKTEVAKVLAAALGRRLIRLQCYEGLDVASALYEWDFARQMLE